MQDRPLAKEEPAAARPFALAHLSDLHATAPRLGSPLDLLGKRALGWLSWRRKRSKEHLPRILEALIADLDVAGADHVGVTGDLTQLGLDSEIEEAAAWLARLGPPSRVSVVPGNHDAYAGRSEVERWSRWAPYMTSTDAAETSLGGFPFLRRLGPVALVGISSARPTALLLATGRIGGSQRERLEELLAGLRGEGLFRVVLMHHPPVPAGQSRRRQLDDSAAVRELLERAGAELVLHGHTHRSSFARIAGPSGAIPVVGVPSASALGHRPERRARYHVYRIVPTGGAPGSFEISLCVRAFDPLRGSFAVVEESAL
jgi:3',5'-cyclic AMP phosphodiesterase CpdA